MKLGTVILIIGLVLLLPRILWSLIKATFFVAGLFANLLLVAGVVLVGIGIYRLLRDGRKTRR